MKRRPKPSAEPLTAREIVERVEAAGLDVSSPGLARFLEDFGLQPGAYRDALRMVEWPARRGRLLRLVRGDQ